MLGKPKSPDWLSFSNVFHSHRQGSSLFQSQIYTIPSKIRVPILDYSKPRLLTSGASMQQQFTLEDRSDPVHCWWKHLEIQPWAPWSDPSKITGLSWLLYSKYVKNHSARSTLTIVLQLYRYTNIPAKAWPWFQTHPACHPINWPIYTTRISQHWASPWGIFLHTAWGTAWQENNSTTLRCGCHTRTEDCHCSVTQRHCWMGHGKWMFGNINRWKHNQSTSLTSLLVLTLILQLLPSCTITSILSNVRYGSNNIKQ